MADKAVASDSVGSVLWRTAPAGGLSAMRCLSDIARSPAPWSFFFKLAGRAQPASFFSRGSAADPLCS